MNKNIHPQFVLLRKNSKLPARKFKDVIFTKNQIITHLRNGGNLGLLAQPNLVFIDIESPTSHNNVDGLQNFWMWCSQNNIDLEDIMEKTLVQRTPTGGIHLIFSRPEKYRFKQDISFLDGVDIKASKNNYILIEPSKIDGKSYKFIDTNKIPLELPIALADAIIARQKAERPTAKNIQTNKATNGLMYRQRSYYPQLDVFYNIEHGWGDKGHRNDNLFKWSGAIRKITDYDTAYKYAKIANKHTDDPISDYELVSTLKSAYSFTSLKTYEGSGTTWVKVIGFSKTENLAVLLSKFEEVQSIKADDYEDDDIYHADEIYKLVSKPNIRDIYHYQEENRK